ncbi:ABC transporter ATP-binding protein [Paenibacillus sp. sgz302251]|uniref:ABC transporter ATP-binding protein n=1 Tax=Paenibacillus sp. sgz302251 TaxID=3414493 RepID=UPI003C7BF143
MQPTLAAGFTNLRLKYPGEDGLLFKGLSLSVQQGEKVLLLGPSGCGKSTVLQVLSGLVPRSIELPMKQDAITVPERSGYVFQDPDAQFCMPYVDEELAFVLENLCVPREEMPARIERLLARVGLQLEHTHTLIQSLSQGMKQRLAVASAMALEPDVLFLDEPTALLDSEGTKQVWDSIKRSTSEQTLIIVEHKIDQIVDWVDRLIVMSPDGALLTEGTPAEVFASHKQQFIEYGIWYPGVWRDHRDNNQKRTSTAKPVDQPDNSALLHMEQFRGYRGGLPKIVVNHMDVTAGEWISVIGANGAGKSSLLLAIMRLIKTDGICSVSGLITNKIELLADRIAFVFQNPEFQFITNSVEDEIAYSFQLETIDKDERKRRVLDVLERFHLLPYKNRHPYQLSMGQKRRLSVAVSIERGQKLLLLDEPTFGLDARNTFSMLDRLEQLRIQGATIILVTHDEEIVQHYSTRVWEIQAGKLTMVRCKEADEPCN